MDVKNIAKLFVGVITFFVLLSLIQATRVFEFAAEAAVENGKLSASILPQSITFSEIASSILGVLVFLFTRLGAGSIAFFQAVFSNQLPADKSTPSTPSVESESVEGSPAITRDTVLNLARAAKAGDRVELVRLANEIHGESFISLSGVRATRRKVSK